MDAISSRWRKLKKKCKSKKMSKHIKELAETRRGKVKSPVSGYGGSSGKSCAHSSDSQEFLLIERSQLAELVKNVICEVCLQKKVEVFVSDRSGLCSKLALRCQECSNSLGVTYSSPRVNCTPSKHAPFFINRKAVESALSIGVGYAGLQKLCCSLNLNVMSSRTFRSHFRALIEETEALQHEVFQEARKKVREAYLIDSGVHVPHNDILDISVSYDGTWQKRGPTALNGVGLVIDLLTGLVLDFEVLSKYCHMCTTTAAELDAESPEFGIWYEGHSSSGECSINFSGPSGNMEAYAAEKIWCRSVDKHKLRYISMLSDGDARTWTHLNRISPYGEDILIHKEECINHVHKRLGKGLRELATKQKLGGKKQGSLTAHKIQALQKYYRRAIVSNLNSVDEMKSAVKATLFHCASTDEEPKHQFCPKGLSSWCFYNKALASHESPPSHSRGKLWLNDTVYKSLIPLYDRLSQDELLQRCTRGATQNSNESLHSQIWRRCSKEIFVSKTRVHMAVLQAVVERNHGILESQGIKARLKNEKLSSNQIKNYMTQDRVREKRKAQQEIYRNSKRLRMRKKPEKSEDYGAGAH